MNKTIPHTLICTVGTSLFKPNLFGLPTTESYESWLSKQPEADKQHFSPELVDSLKKTVTCNSQLNKEKQNWKPTAEYLYKLPGYVRLCGAEINSITDLIKREYCTNNCYLVFCHSATPEGLQIAKILEDYYQLKGHKVNLEEIKDLQDINPKLFRTKGLRNLAKSISRIVRENGSQFCAINATGGYKAQIAIGVLMGQALGVPVYYKHEHFSEIIAFPPMPIGLDFSLWLEISGWLIALDRPKEMITPESLGDDWNEKMETLVERVEMDGKIYFELSPTGQIFHETFKGRFESDKDAVLPPPIPTNQKKQPELTDHGWGNARTKILNFLQKITDSCPYVRLCRTHYWNPDLSSPTLLKLSGEQIEGIFSNGTWTVKFFVETSANTQGQRSACIADMNSLVSDWL
jgi:putative CRISPR-associated protein (TIGR02619 family)